MRLLQNGMGSFKYFWKCQFEESEHERSYAAVYNPCIHIYLFKL